MKKLSIDEVRAVQLEILNGVHRFCEKTGLEYFLTGGTLIGAVRHNGYIPWDDDIDISLKREDYEKLLMSFSDERFKIVSSLSDRHFPFPFAKIIDTKTVLIENSDCRYEMGINIDVFPLDNAPNDEKSLQKKLARLSRLRNIINIKVTSLNKSRDFVKNTALLFGSVMFCGVTSNQISRKMNELAMKSAAEKKIGIQVWGYGSREIADKSVFEKTVPVKFENYTFNAPAGYDLWLTSIYGNYMNLPPKEEQKTHHDFICYERTE